MITYNLNFTISEKQAAELFKENGFSDPLGGFVVRQCDGKKFETAQAIIKILKKPCLPKGKLNRTL